MYDTIFFDLDGTLTDSAPGILNSVRYALEKSGIAPPPDEALLRFIGPPLVTEFQAAFGVSQPEAETMAMYFQERFRAGGLFENRVYDGVPAMLARVLASGRRAAVTTSKPEPFAREIIDHFGLRPYFAAVVGSGLDERTLATKADVVARAVELLAPGRALLVGDRRHDIVGAHQNGLPCLGVLYGYGSREELAGAEYIAATVGELGDILVSL